MIECEKAAPYRYYIENVDDMKRGSIENWPGNSKFLPGRQYAR